MRKYNYIKAFTGKRNQRRFRKASRYASTAVRALAVANRVASLINVEKKYVDTISTGTTLIASSGTPNFNSILLNGMQLGDTSNTREGISVRCQYIYVEGFFVLNQTTTPDDVRVNIMIDKQPNQTAPANMYNPSQSFPISLRNPSYGPRFKVLKDVHLTMSPQSNSTVKFKIYVKCNIHTRYVNGQNSGTITDIESNAIYLNFGGNLSLNMSTINYSARYRFIDN